MEIVPAQSAAEAISAELTPPAACAIAPALLEELWRLSEAETCGLTRTEFEQIIVRAGVADDFGLQAGLASEPSPAQQAAFFATLRMPDLVLARACGQGSERAWERFIALYREPLLRAGIAISGNESLGRELADGLYAELYGLTLRNGERRCPLDSYRGRGSLIGWLRTTLAQRHVDRHRRTHREQPLNELLDYSATRPDPQPQPGVDALHLLTAAVRDALQGRPPEEKFLLASYYLDGRRLHEIAAVMGVHEATVSRKLKRLTGSVRDHILRNLARSGLSRREAQDALATDPRDLTAGTVPGSDHLHLKELLQTSQLRPFKGQAG